MTGLGRWKRIRLVNQIRTLTVFDWVKPMVRRLG